MFYTSETFKENQSLSRSPISIKSNSKHLQTNLNCSVEFTSPNKLIENPFIAVVKEKQKQILEPHTSPIKEIINH